MPPDDDPIKDGGKVDENNAGDGGDVEAVADPVGAAEFQTGLRHGGRIGLTDDAILIERADEQTRVSYDTVTQVTIHDYDYVHAMFSIILIGFGIWFAMQNPLGGIFSIIGGGSGYLVYRNRDRVTVFVRNRPKPIIIHPEELAELLARLQPAIAPEE